ncbi:S-adenosylmethionine decarboxylase proenzyme, prokaryotic class 1B [hydrothermal vent metagenome]|uniref:S-adenosylmethionine decarboxylase proenzyme, prokaryotic class 1B n=1 Tax=hydrothermal vent metagenome TaxID=652676 RepID=A0A3B0WZM6_9ZZZZ
MAENEAQSTSDHFIIRNGQEYSGIHVLIDLWGASSLTDIAFIEATLKECVTVCRATLLHIHLHQFSDSGGISGVAILAESHISLHTWPERDYAAFDVFMCGATQPMLAVEVLKRAFQPDKIDVNEILRGGLT